MYFLIQDKPFGSFDLFDKIGTGIHFHSIGVSLRIGGQICNLCGASLLFINSVNCPFSAIAAVSLCQFRVGRLLFQVDAPFLVFFNPHNILFIVIRNISGILIHQTTISDNLYPPFFQFHGNVIHPCQLVIIQSCGISAIQVANDCMATSVNIRNVRLHRW